MARRERDEFDLDVVWRAERYQRWILDAFETGVAGAVLEVGAGIGAMTRWLAQRARHVTALEPDPGRRALLEELQLPNVTALPSGVESLGGLAGRFDAVVCVNVLEHLDDDRAALAALGRLLVPTGRLCIMVPAHPQLFGSLDRAYGHRRRYTLLGVRRLLIGAGLEVQHSRYLNPIGAVGWLVAGRVLRRRRIPSLAVSVAEQLVVPASRALERLGDPPLGQSVVAVGVRPRSSGRQAWAPAGSMDTSDGRH